MPDQDQIQESPGRHQKLQHLHDLMVDQAIKALETAIGIDPNLLLARNLLVQLHEGQRQFELANTQKHLSTQRHPTKLTNNLTRNTRVTFAK